MKRRKKDIKIFKSRNFTIFVIFLILGLTISWLIWYFSAEVQQARQHKKEAEILVRKIQEQVEKYAVDSYGGETPEETYEMFLHALKTEDIDLASKYFALDKQEEYKQFFVDIKNNNKWEEMIKDLFNPDNQKGGMKENNTYVVRIYNTGNYLIAQAVLKIPLNLTGTKNDLVSSVWKIIEF